MSLGKASIQRAANAEGKAAEKTGKTTKTRTKKATAKKPASSEKTVNAAVIGAADVEEIRTRFLKGTSSGVGAGAKPVGITQELPDYLL